MSDKKQDPWRVVFRDARLGYPNLFIPKKVMNNPELKFSTCLSLDKKTQADQIKQIDDIVLALQKDAYKGKTIPADKIAWKDGSARPSDGFGEGVKFLNAGSPEKYPPKVVDRDMTPINPNDKRIFGGCYVNAVVRFWAQDNEYGRRINASLEVIQYSRPGERFGQAPVEATDFFDVLPPLEEERIIDM